MFRIDAVTRLLTDDNDMKDQGVLGPLVPNGWWSKSAAGALILARDTGRILLQKRAEDEGDAPGMWGEFGGGIDRSEWPERALKRELQEECGLEGGNPFRGGYTHDAYRIQALPYTHRSQDLVYYNFLATVDKEFEPKTNHETADWDWFEFGDWPEPLHPGVIELFTDKQSYRMIYNAVVECKRKPGVRKQMRQDPLPNEQGGEPHSEGQGDD